MKNNNSNNIGGCDYNNKKLAQGRVQSQATLNIVMTFEVP